METLIQCHVYSDIYDTIIGTLYYKDACMNAIKKYLAFGLVIPSMCFSNDIDNLRRSYYFHLALDAISPITAKYSMLYKGIYEIKCDKLLNVDELPSAKFSNVVSVLAAAESTDTLNSNSKKRSALNDSLILVKNNIKCDDLGYPLQALILDKGIKTNHPKFHTFIYKLSEIANSQ